MNIIEEMNAERGMRQQLARIYGGLAVHVSGTYGYELQPDMVSAVFQRIYERERKSAREVLHVLLDMRKQLAA